MGIIITLAVIAIIIVAVKKSKSSKASPSIRKIETQVTLDSDTDFSKFEKKRNPKLGAQHVVSRRKPAHSKKPV